jgi:hypothetical protein
MAAQKGKGKKGKGKGKDKGKDKGKKRENSQGADDVCKGWKKYGTCPRGGHPTCPYKHPKAKNAAPAAKAEPKAAKSASVHTSQQLFAMAAKKKENEDANKTRRASRTVSPAVGKE